MLGFDPKWHFPICAAMRFDAYVDRFRSFRYHISSIYNKAGRRYSALVRLSRSLNTKKNVISFAE